MSLYQNNRPVLIVWQPRILQNQAQKMTPHPRLRRTTSHDLDSEVRETALSHNDPTIVKPLPDPLPRVFRLVDRSDAEDLSGVGTLDQFGDRPFEHVYAGRGFGFFP